MKKKRDRCPDSGKWSYPTFERAIRAALTANQRRGTPLRPYECGCGAWHLTKRPANPRVATVPGPFTPNDLAALVARRQETSA